MPNIQFNGRKGALSRLEIEKVLYATSEKIALAILSYVFKGAKEQSTIDLWELENLVGQILDDAVRKIGTVDLPLAESLSFEIKRRKSALVGDMTNLLLECMKDAFRDSVKITYSTPRMISVTIKANKDPGFMRRELKEIIYEMLRHLVSR